MQVKTENCCGGNKTYYYRLTPPDGERLILYINEGESWNRCIASRALNMLQRRYHLSRSSFKFLHR